MDSGGEDQSVAMNGSRLVQYLDTLLTTDTVSRLVVATFLFLNQFEPG